MNLVKTGLLLLCAGCLTPAQDGHWDACKDARYNVKHNGMAREGLAESDHASCTYNPPRQYEDAFPDPDAYERGLTNGYDDCVRQPYIDKWMELDAATPCADVTASEPLPTADTAEVGS